MSMLTSYEFSLCALGLVILHLVRSFSRGSALVSWPLIIPLSLLAAWTFISLSFLDLSKLAPAYAQIGWIFLAFPIGHLILLLVPRPEGPLKSGRLSTPFRSLSMPVRAGVLLGLILLTVGVQLGPQWQEIFFLVSLIVLMAMIWTRIGDDYKKIIAILMILSAVFYLLGFYFSLDMVESSLKRSFAIVFFALWLALFIRWADFVYVKLKEQGEAS